MIPSYSLYLFVCMFMLIFGCSNSSFSSSHLPSAAALCSGVFQLDIILSMSSESADATSYFEGG